MLAGAYGSALRFLLSIRRYLAVSAAALLLTAAAAWVLVAGSPAVAQGAFAQISAVMESRELFEGEARPGQGDPLDGLRINVPKLVASNLVAMCCGTVLGAVPFLFLPALPLVMNALVVGAMGGILQVSGLSAVYFFAALVPHGIFEIPAMLISYAMGFCLCLTLAGNIVRSPRARSVRGTLMGILRTFVLVVTPLTVLAGLTEAYVTPLILTSLFPL